MIQNIKKNTTKLIGGQAKTIETMIRIMINKLCDSTKIFAFNPERKKLKTEK